MRLARLFVGRLIRCISECNTNRATNMDVKKSSSLALVDTGPTLSSIFGTLPGSPFLSECQALSAIRPGSPQWYRTGVLSASISF